jgi:hypothetical protein
MLRMAVGHSDDIDLEAALAEVFASCEAGLAGATPKAGLVLTPWDTDHVALLRAIHERYPGIELAGSTSGGEMSSLLGLQEDSIALALFAAEGIDITAGIGRNQTEDPFGAARAAVADARSRTTLEPALCVAVPTIGEVEPGVLLEALRAAIGPGVPIVGGGAASQRPMSPIGSSPSGAYVGTDLFEDSVAILLFSGPLAFSYGVETGWRGVGPRGQVTRSHDRWVEEIDGQPALDFYERWIGTREPPFANPLAVHEPNSERFYLRTPVSWNRETGAVAFPAGIPTGSTIQLTVAGIDEVFEGTKQAFASALASYPEGATPQAALVFSCAVRKFVLGSRAGREMDIAREVLGTELPMAGFYCLGEIAPTVSPDVTRFHNETIVALLLGSA